jgi:hypothetical protein
LLCAVIRFLPSCRHGRAALIDDALVNDHERTSCTAAKIPHSTNLTDYQASGAIELLTSGQRAAFSAKR